MSGGGSGGGSSTTVQKADPWVGVQPYLTQGYQQLAGLYQPGQGPQYYPGDTVQQPTPNQTAGLDWMANQAGNMNGVANQAQQNLGTISNNGAAGAGNGLWYGGMGAGGLSNLGQQTSGGAGGAGSAMQQLAAYGNSGATQAGNALTGSSAQQLYNAGNPQNNPYFQQALQSAIRPVTEQFNEQVMPGIKQGAIDAGQLGSSRQGIAEGIAARGYQNTVGDISANMGNAAYAQGLNALQASGQLGQGMTSQGLGALGSAGALGQGLAGLNGQAYGNLGQLGSSYYGQGMTGLGQGTALTNGVQQAQMAPGQMLNQIGQQQTGTLQNNINADMARYNYGQNLPYSMISDYLQMLNGAQGGQTQSNQQQTGGGSNKLMGALGGAGTGAAIGTAFAPGIGTAIGAGAGALLSLF